MRQLWFCGEVVDALQWEDLEEGGGWCGGCGKRLDS